LNTGSCAYTVRSLGRTRKKMALDRAAFAEGDGGPAKGTMMVKCNFEGQGKTLIPERA